MNTARNGAADPRIPRLRSAVDETLALALLGIEPPRLRAALEHALGGGKRIRPLVTMLMCGALGGNDEDAVHAAAALEMLHTSSLVHDDIMDGSHLRRGSATLHTRTDVPTAILTGDMLVALAFRLIRRQDARTPAALLDTFSSAFVQLCEGQALDLDLSGRTPPHPGAHATMVEKKTACLLEASAAIGAMVATDREERIRGAARFGRNLGMAFQAHDDLLDAVGDERTMGKPAGLDARNGRQTFLTLAHPSCTPETDMTASPHDAARAVVAVHTEAACRFLDTMPPSPSREMLRDLTTMLTTRQS